MLTTKIFAQCKIILQGTLIISNLKMINKMPTLTPLEKFLRTPMNDRASRFRFFLLSLITNCLFLSVLLI